MRIRIGTPLDLSSFERFQPRALNDLPTFSSPGISGEFNGVAPNTDGHITGISLAVLKFIIADINMKKRGHQTHANTCLVQGSVGLFVGLETYPLLVNPEV
jgi:hypothetical protein